MCRNNPHPARGRKLLHFPDSSSFAWKQPTPRKGTETCVCVLLGYAHIRNNPHPARGRKLWILAGLASLIAETTHTPQGDGNQDGGDNLALGRKQPTPRKGTETQPFCLANVASEKQPTPRKGTETLSPPVHVRASAETTHTPQGDGNRLSIPVTRHLQETTHTPQGDGKPFVFTLQKLLEKPFTSPAGDN